MNNGNGWGLARTLLTWLLAGVVAIIALKLILRLAGIVIGFSLWALLTLGPIVLLGWLILKALRHFSRNQDYPVS